MNTETLLRVLDVVDAKIRDISESGKVNSLDASDCGRLDAYEEMRYLLHSYVKVTDNAVYQRLVAGSEEEVRVKITWEELKSVLGAVKYVKDQVDNGKLDTAYVKLSTQYRGV